MERMLIRNWNRWGNVIAMYTSLLWSKVESGLFFLFLFITYPNILMTFPMFPNLFMAHPQPTLDWLLHAARPLRVANKAEMCHCESEHIFTKPNKHIYTQTNRLAKVGKMQ